MACDCYFSKGNNMFINSINTNFLRNTALSNQTQSFKGADDDLIYKNELLYEIDEIEEMPVEERGKFLAKQLDAVFDNTVVSDELFVKLAVSESLNAVKHVAPTERANILNKVAIEVFNRPNISSPEFVELAILAMPEEDEKYSASKYATELLRLTKYTSADNQLKAKVKDAIVKAHTSRTLEQASKGFETTHRNVCGMDVDMNKALGYREYQRPGRRFRARKDGEY